MDPMGMINLSICLKDSPRVLSKHWFTKGCKSEFLSSKLWIDYLHYLPNCEPGFWQLPTNTLPKTVDELIFYPTVIGFGQPPPGIQVNFRLNRIRNSFHNFWLCDILCMTCPRSCLFLFAELFSLLCWICDEKFWLDIVYSLHVYI